MVLACVTGSVPSEERETNAEVMSIPGAREEPAHGQPVQLQQHRVEHEEHEGAAQVDVEREHSQGSHRFQP